MGRVRVKVEGKGLHCWVYEIWFKGEEAEWARIFRKVRARKLGPLHFLYRDSENGEFGCILVADDYYPELKVLG